MFENLATEKLDECLLCGSRVFFADEWLMNRIGLISPFAIQCCQICNFRWLSPRPTEAAVKNIYSAENYFGTTAVENFESVARERRIHFADRISRIKRYFDVNELYLLDIGAATGEFVDEAIKQKIYATGVELSQDAVSIAKKKYGIDLICGTLDCLKENKLFDVMHMNHVFEHVFDPVKVLLDCKAHLAANGLLVIEVPYQEYNYLDRLRYLLTGVKRPFTAYSLHHNFFFDPETLKRMILENGFRIESMRTFRLSRSPLFPFNIKNWLLALILFVFDRIGQKGNIIEVYARKK